MAIQNNTLDHALIALADPTRRAILHRLASGETRVTELAHPFKMSLNSVSKHIRLLERADLIKRRRLGREHLISLNLVALDETAAWIIAQRAVWANCLNNLDLLLQAEDAAQKSVGQKKGTSE